MFPKVYIAVLMALAIGNTMANPVPEPAPEPVAEPAGQALHKAVTMFRGNWDKCAAETMQTEKTGCMHKEGGSLRVQGNCKVFMHGRPNCLGERHEVKERNKCVKKVFKSLEVLC